MISVIADCGNYGMGQIGVANRFEGGTPTPPSYSFFIAVK